MGSVVKEVRGVAGAAGSRSGIEEAGVAERSADEGEEVVGLVEITAVGGGGAVGGVVGLRVWSAEGGDVNGGEDGDPKQVDKVGAATESGVAGGGAAATGAGAGGGGGGGGSERGECWWCEKSCKAPLGPGPTRATNEEFCSMESWPGGLCNITVVGPDPEPLAAAAEAPGAPEMMRITSPFS